MTGSDFANLIAAYISHNFAARNLSCYREVNVGTSIIGKRRRIDLLVVNEAQDVALAIECKYQDSQGTADEKIPYALQDLESMRMPSCLVYSGTGFSEGVLHMLQSSEIAAYCFPSKSLDRVGLLKGSPTDSGTWQLDHILAQVFRWWDMLIGTKSKFTVSP